MKPYVNRGNNCQSSITDNIKTSIKLYILIEGISFWNNANILLIALNNMRQNKNGQKSYKISYKLVSPGFQRQNLTKIRMYFASGGTGMILYSEWTLPFRVFSPLNLFARHIFYICKCGRYSKVRRSYVALKHSYFLPPRVEKL